MFLVTSDIDPFLLDGGIVNWFQHLTETDGREGLLQVIPIDLSDAWIHRNIEEGIDHRVYVVRAYRWRLLQRSVAFEVGPRDHLHFIHRIGIVRCSTLLNKLLLHLALPFAGLIGVGVVEKSLVPRHNFRGIH